MVFKLTVLGSSAAVPTMERGLSAYVLSVGQHLFLIDCGEGTQLQMMKYKIKRNSINHIFISHLHGDHYYGLVGLITSYALLGRTAPLMVYAPEGLSEIMAVNFKHSQFNCPFPLFFVVLDTTERRKIMDTESLEVWHFPLEHRIATCGFLFKEKPFKRRLLKEKIAQYEIPHSFLRGIKNGDDFELSDGTIVSNVELTKDPPPPRSFAYCSDTRFSEAVIDAVKGVDLLFHEATFLEEMREHAEFAFHSTAIDAANVALRAGVEKLVIGHFSSRYYDDTPLTDEAKTVFPNTFAAYDGANYEIPFEKKI
ncbi:MAG: hypothetical protein RL757_2310 [Bacteroidota bacterium]|jgi:ribonuclease Z